MALTLNTQTNQNGVTNLAIGKVTTDAAAAVATTFTLGFAPRRIFFINLTDRITDLWLEGMAAANSLHGVAVGTQTLETVNGITVSGNTFTVTAATLLASKTFHWYAEA